VFQGEAAFCRPVRPGRVGEDTRFRFALRLSRSVNGGAGGADKNADCLRLRSPIAVATFLLGWLWLPLKLLRHREGMPDWSRGAPTECAVAVVVWPSE
jgi:hypothetical protein